MKIKEFSKHTGVSIYTLHYYEKIGLLRHIRRDQSSHRTFSQADVDWMFFITWLKKTGMSLANIQKYADLREQGEITAMPRKNLLEQHALIVEERIALEQTHLKKLKDKIQYYEKLLKNEP